MLERSGPVQACNGIDLLHVTRLQRIFLDKKKIRVFLQTVKCTSDNLLSNC